MERKIGEEFEYKGKTLKVYKTHSVSCNGCILYGMGRCTAIDIFGACVGSLRTDKNNVIFKEIKK